LAARRDRGRPDTVCHPASLRAGGLGSRRGAG
jgi:hypothetical protein